IKRLLAAALMLGLAMTGWAQAPRATLAEQKICAKRATVVLNRYLSDTHQQNKSNAFEISHLDPKARICYVAIESTIDESDGVTVSTFVSDAFEGSPLASSMSHTDTKSMDTKVVMCNVGEVSCKSNSEFRHLVYSKFGLVIP